MNRARLTLLILVLIASLLASGCWDLRPVEDLSLLTVLAMDKPESGEGTLFTASQPLFATPRTADSKTSWGVAKDLSQAEHILHLQSNKRVVLGKVIIYLFGEDFLKSGKVVTFAQAAIARPELSLTATVAAVKGKAQDLLAMKPPELPSPGQFAWEMLKSEGSRGHVPNPMLGEIARQRPLNQDMWMPLLEPVEELKTIRLAGSIVFNGEKPALELSVEETGDLMWLKGASPAHAFEVGKQVDGNTLSAGVTRSKSKFQVKHNTDGTQSISIRMKSRVVIDNPIDTASGPKERIKQLESDIASELTGRAQKLLAKLQAADSDPLGLTSPGVFTSAQEISRMRQQYSSSKLDITVTVQVVGLGSR